jgi:hypothetical protein
MMRRCHPQCNALAAFHSSILPDEFDWQPLLDTRTSLHFQTVNCYQSCEATRSTQLSLATRCSPNKKTSKNKNIVPYPRFCCMFGIEMRHPGPFKQPSRILQFCRNTKNWLERGKQDPPDTDIFLISGCALTDSAFHLPNDSFHFSHDSDNALASTVRINKSDTDCCHLELPKLGDAFRNFGR